MDTTNTEIIEQMNNLIKRLNSLKEEEARYNLIDFQVSKIEQELEEKTKTLSDIKDRIKESQAECASAMQVLQEVKTQIENKDKEIAEVIHYRDLANLSKKQLNEIETQTNEANENIKVSLAKIKEYQDKLENLEDEFNKRNSEYEEIMEVKKNEINSEISNLTSIKESLVKEIQGLNFTKNTMK